MGAKQHLAKGYNQGPVCGAKGKVHLVFTFREHEQDWCKKCRAQSCPDCMGTGLMGGRTVGIYCSCEYSYSAELREFLRD